MKDILFYLLKCFIGILPVMLIGRLAFLFLCYLDYCNSLDILSVILTIVIFFIMVYPFIGKLVDMHDSYYEPVLPATFVTMAYTFIPVMFVPNEVYFTLLILCLMYSLYCWSKVAYNYFIDKRGLL